MRFTPLILLLASCTSSQTTSTSDAGSGPSRSNAASSGYPCAPQCDSDRFCGLPSCFCGAETCRASPYGDCVPLGTGAVGADCSGGDEVCSPGLHCSSVGIVNDQCDGRICVNDAGFCNPKGGADAGVVCPAGYTCKRIETPAKVVPLVADKQGVCDR